MSTSRYLEIADVLSTELADRKPGTRLASEHEIASRFAVGRAAARAAVQELEARLLVRRVRGSGTFVNRRIDYVISRSRPPSWHRTVEAAGAKARSVVRGVERVRLAPDQAELLRREVGEEAHLLLRQYYIDDLLASWSSEWIPTDVVADIDPAVYAVESVDEILRQLGRVDPVRAWCRVSVDVPADRVVEELATERGRPQWLVESVSRDRESGRPVMCSHTWSLPTATRLIVELDGPWESENGGQP
ncbi:MAG TPA: GntR family transcriptional regulator [Mycobacteriales bacterium]|nr:GntR family transcriptional regulator [Mycobacteriales bacterium]